MSRETDVWEDSVDTRGRWGLLPAAAVALCVGLSSCAMLPSKPHVAPKPPPAPPVPADLVGLPLGSPLFAAHTVAAEGALTLDPCALHDPQVASQVTGQPPDQLQPGDHLNECTMRTGTIDQGWNLYVTAGAEFSAMDARSGAPANFGGLPVSRTDTGHQCEYSHEVKPGSALQLSVQPSGGDPPPGAACRIGAQYLQRMAPWWAHPPQRRDHATAPVTHLGQGPGPCAALRPLMGAIPALPNTMATQVEHTGREPSECQITDRVPLMLDGVGSNEPSRRVEVGYEFNHPPTGPEAIGAPIQVAGRPAEVLQQSDGCEVTTQAEPAVVELNKHLPGTDTVVPEVVVRASTCEAATVASGVAVQVAES